MCDHSSWGGAPGYGDIGLRPNAMCDHSSWGGAPGYGDIGLRPNVMCDHSSWGGAPGYGDIGLRPIIPWKNTVWGVAPRYIESRINQGALLRRRCGWAIIVVEENYPCDAQRLGHGDTSAPTDSSGRRSCASAPCRRPACQRIRRVSRDLVRRRRRRSRARRQLRCSSATGCFRPWANRCCLGQLWRSTGHDNWPRG